MNQSIVRLFVLVAVLFGLLVAWTSRWTVFEAEALRDNALNRRELLEEQRIRRGPIRARDGSLLARAVPSGAGTFTRRYPTGDLFAHAVGYSFLTIGRFGLEQSRNDPLTGRTTGVTSVIDQLSGKEPEGEEVRTTLDPRAQRTAIRALGGRRGAVVAIEPATGKVRVMASVPAFDPNELRDARSLDALSNGSALNRTTLGQYPPGSTFKVVTAVAAIDSGRYTKDSQVSGRSPKTISGAPLQNSGGKDFGTIPLTTALTNSVNTVWAEVGETLGGETMQRYMERFGFDSTPTLDYPATQMTPSGEYYRGHLIAPASRFVDVGRMGIGQDKLSVTPLQMAEVAAAVANGGTLMRPHLTDRIVDPDGRTVQRIQPEVLSQVMRPSTAQAVNGMMQAVVTSGTGTPAQIPGMKVAGKTGTAETQLGTTINNVWFIAFAPADHPRVAVAVTVAGVPGFGAQFAAPIAKQVMEALLK